MKRSRTCLAVGAAFLGALALCAQQPARAAVPGEISFQGFLTDGSGVPINGSVSMTFRIFDVATAGTELWSETQPTVSVDEGRYAVLLGTVTSLTGLAFDLDYWLGVEVETDGEMTPRYKIATSPFAFTARNAQNADTVDGLDASATPMAGELLALDASGMFPSSVLPGAAGAVTQVDTGLGLMGGPITTTGTIDLNLNVSGGLENTQGAGSDELGIMAGTLDGQILRWDDSLVQWTLDMASTDAATLGGLANTAFWQIGGNIGLIDGTDNFFGTTDNVALNVIVNNERALRIEPTATADGPNIIGGHFANTVTGGVVGATISGGGFNDGVDFFENRVTADYGTIGGGADNTAGGFVVTIGGGANNTASMDFATVSGGQWNAADGWSSTVGGGQWNIADGDSATIGGGDSNWADGWFATVGGGQWNAADGDSATIGGGEGNSAGFDYATVGGGWGNMASAFLSTVGGGAFNMASIDFSTVGGGIFNNADGIYSTIGGGDSNIASFDYATVGGGDTNTAGSNYSTVAGGWFNSASGTESAVGGGQGNAAGGSNATVPGGLGNTASGNASTVGGGQNNTASAQWSTVGGGTGNTADGDSATVVGGGGNTADSTGATVGGGTGNTASFDYATVSGGLLNTTGMDFATVSGGLFNVADGAAATVGGGGYNLVSMDYATVSGGIFNTAGGGISTVGGGINNAAFGWYATVGGGERNLALALFATIGGGGPMDTSSPALADLTNNRVFDEYGTIGGGGYNRAGSDDPDPTNAAFATVGGGRRNTASGLRSTVGGGSVNVASASYATIGGGDTNAASGGQSTVGGGSNNTASGGQSTVGGGQWNAASGINSTVGGGVGNWASGGFATVPGGNGNTAAGWFSFAAGNGANVQAADWGSFVWADNQGGTPFNSVAGNEFAARATGGVRFVTAVNVGGVPTAGVAIPGGTNSLQAIGAGNLTLNGATDVIGDLYVSGNTTLNANLNVDAGTLYVNAANNTVNVGTTVANTLWKLYAYRPFGDFGADKASVYGYRGGGGAATNGGTDWTIDGVDAAVKGYSFYGNEFSAGVYGTNFGDFTNCAGVVGAVDWDSSTRGFLGYIDSASTLWAGYFEGNVNVNGDTTVNGTFSSTGNATIGGTLSAGNTTVSGTFSSTGNATVGGTLSAGNTTVSGTFSSTGNATVGGTLSAGDTTVTGNIGVSGNINYTTPKTYYHTIPPAAFERWGENTTFWLTNYGRYAVRDSSATGASTWYMAPVNLPDGAVVTRVDSYVYDTSTTSNVTTHTVWLYRTSLVDGGATTMANASRNTTIAESAGMYVATDTTISSPVIDNANYSHSLEVAIGMPVSTFSLSYYGVRITYTLSSVSSP